NLRLLYATNASGTWVTAPVDTSITGIFSNNLTALAVDVNGRAHIGYRDLSYALKYATNSSGTWQTTVVDNNTNVGRRTSLVLDGSGRVHLAYAYDDGNRNIFRVMYATNSSGAWALSPVEDVGGNGGDPSLAIGGDGTVHLAYLSVGVCCPTND